MANHDLPPTPNFFLTTSVYQVEMEHVSQDSTIGTAPESGTRTVTSPDLLLAKRAARADAQAWEEIVARFGERIYNLAFRFTGNAGEAEELTQDVFLKLYRNLGRYRGDVPFVGWALRLSRNACIDHFRHHRRRVQSEVSETPLRFMTSGDDPHRETWLAHRRRLVHQTLAEMSEDQATVIAMCDLQGWSYDEAAAFLEVPLGTVKSRLNRARRELFLRLESQLADAPNLRAHGEASAQDPRHQEARR